LGKRGSTNVLAGEAQHRPETFPTGDIGRRNSGKRGRYRRLQSCIDGGKSAAIESSQAARVAALTAVMVRQLQDLRVPKFESEAAPRKREAA